MSVTLLVLVFSFFTSSTPSLETVPVDVTFPVSSIVNVISGDNKDIVKFSLSQPICVEIGENVTLSRKVEKWRLIGWGKVLDGGETI